MDRNYVIHFYNMLLAQASSNQQANQDYFSNAVLNTELEISFQLGTGEPEGTR